MVFSGSSVWFGILILIMINVLLCLYSLPTILALVMKHPHKFYIIVLNVFSIISLFVLGRGVAILGWVLALLWCFVRGNKLQNLTAPPKLDS